MTSQSRDKTRDSTKHDTAKFGIDLYRKKLLVCKRIFDLGPNCEVCARNLQNFAAILLPPAIFSTVIEVKILRKQSSFCLKLSLVK